MKKIFTLVAFFIPTMLFSQQDIVKALIGTDSTIITYNVSNNTIKAIEYKKGEINFTRYFFNVDIINEDKKYIMIYTSAGRIFEYTNYVFRVE